MKNNRPTLAQYFVEQSCPDNKFLEEMNNVIPWWEIEAWFKGHLKKERKSCMNCNCTICTCHGNKRYQRWLDFIRGKCASTNI